MRWADMQNAFAAAMAGDEAEAAALLTPGSIAPTARLAIYRSNVQLTLIDALAETYRAVQQLVGKSYFASLAQAYIAHYPLESANLNDYGEKFSELLANHPVCEHCPYLPDVAQFEWAWQRAYYACDAKATRWWEQDEARLMRSVLQFHPSVQLVQTAYPAAAIWHYCVIDAGEGDPPPIDPAACAYVLARFVNTVAITPVSFESMILLQELKQGTPVGTAMQTQSEATMNECLRLLLTQPWVIDGEEQGEDI